MNPIRFIRETLAEFLGYVMEALDPNLSPVHVDTWNRVHEKIEYINKRMSRFEADPPTTFEQVITKMDRALVDTKTKNLKYTMSDLQLVVGQREYHNLRKDNMFARSFSPVTDTKKKHHVGCVLHRIDVIVHPDVSGMFMMPKAFTIRRR